jgi:hypothetical protein
MSDTVDKPAPVVSSGARVRASGPILILAVLFVVAVFLSWYFTWFGRRLSDADISQYLSDEKKPRHVQHALLQIQERLEKRDEGVRQWYPQIIALAANPETEFRLTVAWLMGSDNRSPEFHQTLMGLLQDAEPIVRRNAALSLVRFNDSAGRAELLSILEAYKVPAPLEGVVTSALQPRSALTRGTLLARIQKPDGSTEEVRSPLPGKIESTIVSSGAKVAVGDPILTITSDEESIWEALRALAIAGQPTDLPLIERYLNQSPDVSERLRQQAALTVKSITSRGPQSTSTSLVPSPRSP